MESAAVLRSFQYSICTSSDVKSVLRKPGMATTNNASLFGGKTFSSSNRLGALYLSCAKKSETTVAANTKSESNGAVLSDSKPGKKLPFTGTFPTGFEDMLSEVCDETQIAELRVKYGSFEINMKRKIDSPAVSAPIVHQAATPPAPSKPASESTPAAPKSSTEKVSPFTNISVEKATKLDALKASGSSGYVIVSSPTVGSFRRARTLKGKKQQPACKEGDVIKEGQVIGYLDQFGTELPVNSDVEGEVLKILFTDGEPVGYGDPLMAVLPSFHGIR